MSPPAYEDKMQLDPAESQSSSAISSPPVSPPQNQSNDSSSDTIRVRQPHESNPKGVSNSASATTSQNGNSVTSHPNGTAAPEKPKRQRRKKATDSIGKPTDDGKPKKESKPRKPRQPKDPNAPPPASRKRQKKEEGAATKAATQDAPTPSRQPSLLDLVSTWQAPAQPVDRPLKPRPQPQSAQQNQSPPVSSADTKHNTLGIPASNPPTPRPLSSGQNYDPIRSMTVEPAQIRAQAPAPVGSSAHASLLNRASASPSIASLIDPPIVAKSPVPPAIPSPHAEFKQPLLPSKQQQPVTLPPSHPASSNQQLFSNITADTKMKPSSTPAPVTVDGAMDLDSRSDPPAQQPTPEVKVTAKSSSSGPTPKARPTPPPAPVGTGSGLLSSSDLFGGPSTGSTVERKRHNIDIIITLNPLGGNSINAKEEIKRKYGLEALNPRAAEHKARLLQVAAAANKIEGGSADDMSVDLVSEMGDDSNAEMGGLEDEKSGTVADNDGDKTKKKRKKRTEDYDKEDDFIDDTELAWQEQAAVAKDGFFVYSGPLVPEGESAKVESTGSTRSGRGRGRGSRGGRVANSTTTHASLKDKPSKTLANASANNDPNASPSTTSTGRGRGRGRGRGMTKVRATKADQERNELAKADRPGPITQTTTGTAGSGVPTTAQQMMMMGGAPLSLGTVPQQSSPSSAAAAQHPQHQYTQGLLTSTTS